MPDVVLPLTVRNLTSEDLYPGFFGWSDVHLGATHEALARAAKGDVDFLAVSPPSGVPVATGGVDYAKPCGVPTIWQLEVYSALRSCGIGTILIRALEQRVRERGHTQVEIGVDAAMSRPQALYERLGYAVSGQEHASWDVQAADGTVSRYEATITLLRKQLS